MGEDFERFKQTVEQREQFYETVDIQTIAVATDSEWVNIHTDVFLRPESDAEFQSQSDTTGPVSYYRTQVGFDGFWELFEHMFSEEYPGHQEPIRFLNVNESGADWKELASISRGDIRDFDRAENAYSMRIKTNDESLHSNQNEIDRRLREEDPPYTSVLDYSKNHLGHMSFSWDGSEVQFFAPLYVTMKDSNITEKGNYCLQIETHDSITDLVVSTWARDDGQIIDRDRHESLEIDSSDGPFHVHKLEWTIDGYPDEVSYSAFHPVFNDGEFQMGTQSPHSVLFQVAEFVLGKSPDEFNQLMDQFLTNDGDICKNRDTGLDGFEASVLSLFSLAGLSAYSPEWYSPEADKESLPDIIACTEYGYRILVCECSMVTKETKMRNKIDDVVANADDLKTQFSERSRGDVEVIPVFATPTTNVSKEMLISDEIQPDSIELLTGETLTELRRLAAENKQSDPLLEELFDTVEAPEL